MQFSKIFVTAFAAVVTAAPAVSQESTSSVEKRSFLGADQLSLLNNLNFGVNDFAYLSSINGLGFDFFDQQLFSLVQRGFDVSVFNPLFSSQTFDINSLALLIQLQMLTHLSSLGVFSQFNLGGVTLCPTVQFGLLQQSLGGINFGQFIDQTIITQVQTIASSSGLFGNNFGTIGFRKE